MMMMIALHALLCMNSDDKLKQVVVQKINDDIAKFVNKTEFYEFFYSLKMLSF